MTLAGVGTGLSGVVPGYPAVWVSLFATGGNVGFFLACFLLGGVAGTLLGGRIADRFGLTRTILVGNRRTFGRR